MAGRNEAAKRAFHRTAAQAVSTRLGSAWETVGPGDDSWTARFARRTNRSTHLLQLKLAVPHHVVEVTLAVELDPNVLLPKVWWEDRSLHPGTSGFKNIELPDHIQQVILAPDGDEAGQAVIQAAARRLAGQGREVRTVLLPAGLDWVDALEEYEERAGIMEFDFVIYRPDAEALARREVIDG